MSDRVERLRKFVAGYHPKAEALMALLDELERLREALKDSVRAANLAQTECARLRRIEEAARAYVEWANAIVPTEPFARLCAALKEEA